jgi:hypothetical protein
MLLTFGKQVYGCMQRWRLNLRDVGSEADTMADRGVAHVGSGVHANTLAP